MWARNTAFAGWRVRRRPLLRLGVLERLGQPLRAFADALLQHRLLRFTLRS